MREVLKHKSVEKVVMVDIDEAVTTFCKTHLEANTQAFEDPRLELINDDARTQLEQYPSRFDVIVGDLADPVEGGPCYQVTAGTPCSHSSHRDETFHAPRICPHWRPSACTSWFVVKDLNICKFSSLPCLP